jgi:hypothetical protein
MRRGYSGLLPNKHRLLMLGTSFFFVGGVVIVFCCSLNRRCCLEMKQESFGLKPLATM